MYSDPLAPVMMGRLSGNIEVIALEASHRSAMIELAAANIPQGQKSGYIAAAIDRRIAAAAIIGGIHGWPSTVFGGTVADAFHVVIRSLRGFAFSDTRALRNRTGDKRESSWT
jgi:hypothetical protein